MELSQFLAHCKGNWDQNRQNRCLDQESREQQSPSVSSLQRPPLGKKVTLKMANKKIILRITKYKLTEGAITVLTLQSCLEE